MKLCGEAQTEMIGRGASVIAMLAGLLLVSSCSPRNQVLQASGEQPSRPRNLLRVKEDLIKSSVASQLEKVTSNIFTLHVISQFADSRTIPSPVDISPIDPRHLLILDNNLSRIYEISLTAAGVTGIKQIRTKANLEYPNILRIFGSAIYTLDDAGIHVDEHSGSRGRIIRSFFAMWDFVPIDGDHIVASPRLTGSIGPLLMEFDKSGRRIGQYGSFDWQPFSGIEGQASLATCDRILLAGLTYGPVLYFFSLRNHDELDVQLPAPGERELEALERQPQLVHPDPHIYYLPTFIGGVSCAEQSAFVLLDYPVFCIYRLPLNSDRVSAIYEIPNLQQGTHFKRLVVKSFGGHLYFYSIATDSTGASRIFIAGE